MQRFAITPGLLKSNGSVFDLERLAARCGELGQEGVEFLLIREKQLTDRELYLLTHRVLKAVDGTPVRVMVAGPYQVARAATADGVHVGTKYGLVQEVKRSFIESWVSASCHSLADVEAAKSAGVDVCLFGPVFGKTVDGVQVMPGVGFEALREACEIAGKDLPTFALGGVTEANASECVMAGASGDRRNSSVFPELVSELDVRFSAREAIEDPQPRSATSIGTSA